MALERGHPESFREAGIDRQVSALYLPAPELRQASGLTPAEIKLVEESVKK